MLPLLLGASPNIVRAAQAVAPRVLLADRTPPTGLVGLLRGERDQFFTVDHTDLRAIERFASVLVGDLRPDAVVSVTESGLLAAARLNELLGLPGVPVEVVRRTQDKLEMRHCLAERAPELAWPAAPGTDDVAVRGLLEHGPCILKPVDGTASRGVHRLAGPADLARVPAQERARAVVERQASGVEVSVETMSRGGLHTVVCVVEKLTGAGAVELAHLAPAPSLSAADLERVAQATRTCLTALGLDDGPSHTEMFVSPETVTIVETHNRPGGDGIADLVQLTTGIDWRRACVGWHAEPLEAAVADAGRSAAAAMVFFTAPPGTVRSVSQEAPAVSGARVVSWHVDVAPGDRVGPLRSSEDRIGAARLVADSPQELAAAVEDLLARDVVETEEGAA